MKYNDNITLLRIATRAEELQENEFYVLMVTDETNKPTRSVSDYWNHEKAYLGLERTSGKSGIYISKQFGKRSNRQRGVTFIARVDDPAQCHELK